MILTTVVVILMTFGSRNAALPLDNTSQGTPQQNDMKPKVVSLQGMIADLENGLYRSAFSASPRVGMVPEPTEHSVARRQFNVPSGITHSQVKPPTTTELPPQTTNTAPQLDAQVPLLNDRVAMGINVISAPFLPTFQVHHTKLVSAVIKEPGDGEAGNSTQISITKTVITKNRPVETLVQPNLGEKQISTIVGNTTSGELGTIISPGSADSTNNSTLLQVSNDAFTPTPLAHATTESTTLSTTSTTLISTAESFKTGGTNASAVADINTSTTTTPKTPVEILKEAEQDLKEKVAEIEADPVILTARV